jgi:hypothetical protein
MVSQEVPSPSICCCSSARWPVRRAAPEQVGQGVGLVLGEPDHLLAGVEVVGVIQRQITPAAAVRHHPKVPAGAHSEFVEPDSGPHCLLNVHPLPLVLFVDPCLSGQVEWASGSSAAG